MANILTDLLKTKDLTPVLATEKNNCSSHQGESKFSVEKIVIKTDLVLKKEGSILFIEEEEINLEQKNVLDVLILLRKKGIKVAFINNTDYWYYPALCILDFCNKEVYEETLQSTPMHLQEFKYFKNFSITPLDQVEITVRRVFNSSLKEQLPFKVIDNYLIIERGFVQYTKFIFEIRTKEFTIKLGNKFNTQEIETVSRYIEEKNVEN